jgi:hypothetical protein
MAEWVGPRLGELATGQTERDAIHIAVIPIVAGEALFPGIGILIRAGKAWRADRDEESVGVADPFLHIKRTIEPGERFWLLLNPGSITSLRHQWTHPAFPIEAPAQTSADKAASEAWLHGHCKQYRIGYDELIEGAVDGEGACFGHDDGPQWTRSDEFWWHVENVTGKRLSPEHRENTWFHCSC